MQVLLLHTAPELAELMSFRNTSNTLELQADLQCQLSLFPSQSPLLTWRSISFSEMSKVPNVLYTVDGIWRHINVSSNPVQLVSAWGILGNLPKFSASSMSTYK